MKNVLPPRMLEAIYKDLKSSQSKVRYLAVAELVVSAVDDKENLLEDAFNKESDLKIKYHIKNAINLVKQFSVENSIFISSHHDDTSKRIKMSLLSEDEVMVKRAFSYIIQNRRFDFFRLMQDLEVKWQSPFYKKSNIKLISLMGPLYLKELVIYFHDKSTDVLKYLIEVAVHFETMSSIAMVCRLTLSDNEELVNCSIEALKEMDQTLLKRILFRMSDSHQCPYQLAILKIIDQLSLSYGALLLRKLSSSEFDEVFEKSSVMLKQKKFNENQSILEESLEEAWGIEEVDTIELNLEYEVIVTTIQSSKDEKQIASCLAQLSNAEIGNNQKQRLLDSFVNHPDHRVRANAVEGLRLIWDIKERSYFLNFLSDKNNRVLGNAVIALGESSKYKEDYHEAVYILLESMLEDEAEFKSTALYCIGLLEFESYLPLLKKQLQKSDQVHDCLILLENWSKANIAAKDLLQNFHKELSIEKHREKNTQNIDEENPEEIVVFADLQAKVKGWERSVVVQTAIQAPRKKLSESKVRFNPNKKKGMLSALNYNCDQCKKKAFWASIELFGYRYCSHECKLKSLGEPEFCKFCDFVAHGKLETINLEKGIFNNSMMFQGESCHSCGSEEKTLIKKALLPLFALGSYKVFQLSDTDYIVKKMKLNLTHFLFSISPILTLIAVIVYFVADSF
ncbi:MAG: hypothetical protein COB02_05460 [Candidatus Cloacimonadota bacterium]|nr:MAG: hypothetical protein COB02_05460 [Candidatus Cloacimonadota bacterium]